MKLFVESSRGEKELWFRMCARTWPGGQSRGFSLQAAAGELRSKLLRRPRRRARDGTATYLWLSSFVYRLIRLFISSPILKTTATKKSLEGSSQKGKQGSQCKQTCTRKRCTIFNIYTSNLWALGSRPFLCVSSSISLIEILQFFPFSSFFWFCNFHFRGLKD